MGDDDNRNYTIFPGNKLRVGIAHFTIGSKETDWGQIFNLSTSDENRDRPALHLEDLQELAVIPLDDETAPIPKEMETFAAAVNDVLMSMVPIPAYIVQRHRQPSTVISQAVIQWSLLSCGHLPKVCSLMAPMSVMPKNQLLLSCTSSLC
jgi:hypothetical protein